MKGSHRIIVESRKVKYDFVIHRNITVITGDSGSGKTVLIDLIHDYGRYGADSGVFLSCDCPCKVIDSEDWERQIEETTESIIFIDEGNRFLISKKFAQLVQGSDNYFVLATREKLPALPYSVNEVYGFRKSGKFHDAKQKYNEIYHLYGEISEVNVEMILQNPEEYIDSKEYVSWERYFTDLLIESTSKNFIWAYSKKRLTKAYFAPRIVNAVKAIMKLVDWEKDRI